MFYDAFVFDFDYTLADTSDAIITCFNHSLASIGLQPMPADKIAAAIGLTLTQMFEKVTGITCEETTAQFLKTYKAKADEIMATGTHFYPDAVKLLRRLKGIGVKTAIVSNKNRCRIEAALNTYGHSPLIDVIVGGEDVQNHKPDPEALLKAAEMLGFDKSKILYIGDSVIDAKTAEAASVDFAATLTGATKGEEFLRYPFKIIAKDLGALALLI